MFNLAVKRTSKHWDFFKQKEGNLRTNHITYNRAFQPRDVSSSFSCQVTDLLNTFISDQNIQMVFIVHAVGMERLFILDSNRETLYHSNGSLTDIWPQNTAESALVSELEDTLIVCMTVSCMIHKISLIVINGLSHRGLFKASGPPGATVPKERLLWQLDCFYTLKQRKTKWAS